MLKKSKQGTATGLLTEAGVQQKCADKSRDNPQEPYQSQTVDTKSTRSAQKKKRTTSAEMKNRNREVTTAAVDFHAKHRRPPTVAEIVAETKYSRRQIYSTTAYKEGKIDRNRPKSESIETGDCAGETGCCPQSRDDATSAQPPASEPVQPDAPTEQPDPDTEDAAATEPAEPDSPVCYLCKGKISSTPRVECKCPRCGNRACSSCLALIGSPDGLCVCCEQEIAKRKAMWDKIALICIIIVVIVTLYFILMGVSG